MGRIEKSAELLVDTNLINMITNHEVLVVSGQPLRVLDNVCPENDRFLEQCEPLQEELLVAPFDLFLQRVPRFGHSNHAQGFLSDEGYPALRGYTLTELEVVMGIHEALGFSIKPPR